MRREEENEAASCSPVQECISGPIGGGNNRIFKSYHCLAFSQVLIGYNKYYNPFVMHSQVLEAMTSYREQRWHHSILLSPFIILSNMHIP